MMNDEEGCKRKDRRRESRGSGEKIEEKKRRKIKE